MDIRTGFHQHGDFAMILYDMPCKIITGKIGANDLKLLFLAAQKPLTSEPACSLSMQHRLSGKRQASL